MDSETRNPSGQEPEKNYDLKSQDVEDLLTEDAPEYSQEELNKYRTKKGFHIPNWLKIVFLKFWFSGAVCYFILWGLGMYLPELEQLFVLSVALGMVTDLLLNNVIRFIEQYPGQNNVWMFFPKKGTLALILNVLYGFLIVFCVYNLYGGVNEFLNLANETEGQNYFGVEPLMFGLFCMGFDLVLLAIKRLFMSILEDAKAAAKTSR